MRMLCVVPCLFCRVFHLIRSINNSIIKEFNMFKTCEHIITSFRARETDGKREQKCTRMRETNKMGNTKLMRRMRKQQQQQQQYHEQ